MASTQLAPTATSTSNNSGTWNTLNNGIANNVSDILSGTGWWRATIGTYLTGNLTARAYGFAIPTGATINGIRLDLAKYQQTGAVCQDAHIQLQKTTGVYSVSNYADTVTTYPSSSTVFTYGGATDLWGDTWTPTIINGATFGAFINATYNNASGSSALRCVYNWALITVYYTAAATVTQNSSFLLFFN